MFGLNMAFQESHPSYRSGLDHSFCSWNGPHYKPCWMQMLMARLSKLRRTAHFNEDHGLNSHIHARVPRWCPVNADDIPGILQTSSAFVSLATSTSCVWLARLPSWGDLQPTQFIAADLTVGMCSILPADGLDCRSSHICANSDTVCEHGVSIRLRMPLTRQHLSTSTGLFRRLSSSTQIALLENSKPLIAHGEDWISLQ